MYKELFQMLLYKKRNGFTTNFLMSRPFIFGGGGGGVFISNTFWSIANFSDGP